LNNFKKYLYQLTITYLFDRIYSGITPAPETPINGVGIHYEESQRLKVTIYLGHNPIMPRWPASQDFTVLVGADHAGVYRPTWTMHFENRTRAYDLREKAKKNLWSHELFRAYGHQLVKLRSATARSVEHLQAG
jgi:hypothetical protein